MSPTSVTPTGRLTPGARRALEWLRDGAPVTATQLAQRLWPMSDVYSTTKSATGLLSRLRASGHATRTGAQKPLYAITRRGHLALVQDEILAGDAVLLDGRPAYPARDPDLAGRILRFDAVVISRDGDGWVARLEPGRRDRWTAEEVIVHLPQLLRAYLDEVAR